MKIISFTVDGEAWNIAKSGNPILISNPAAYPKGTGVSNLMPVIEISKGASLNHPLSGKSHNFSSPVSFVVTAEDGKTTKTYSAMAMVE